MKIGVIDFINIAQKAYLLVYSLSKHTLLIIKGDATKRTPPHFYFLTK